MPDISVIIPTINDPYLERTIASVKENAEGPIEVIVVNDGGTDGTVGLINHPVTVGKRVSVNQAAQLARGKYLFILDAHCSMSKGWDTKMKESVRDKNLVYCMIRDMDSKTWEYRPGDYLHVRLNREWTEKWWSRRKLDKCEVEEESMTITGCAWMIDRIHYWQLGGFDESLGFWGWEGPEWTCKIWMGKDPGKVILRTDVICGHIFGTNKDNKLYTTRMIPESEYFAYMQKKWGDKIQALADYFGDVPEWITEPKGKEMGKERKVVIHRNDETITKDDTGTVIKKVVEYYEYVHKDDGNGPTEAELAKKYTSKAKKIREEVWELKDGKLSKVA